MFVRTNVAIPASKMITKILLESQMKLKMIITIFSDKITERFTFADTHGNF